MSQDATPSGQDRTADIQRDDRARARAAGRAQRAALDYLDRLAADDDLVRYLQLTYFDTSTEEWTAFSLALVEYGYSVFSAWFRSGEIVTRLAAKHVRGPRLPSPFALPEDGPHELAAELMIVGLPSFRSKVLLEGGWKADGGATLRTFFIGHLLYLVPRVYQQWRASNGLLTAAVPLHQEAGHAGGMDRVELRAGLDLITDQLTATELTMFQRQADDSSVREIADALGVSEAKVKTDMMRARDRVKGRFSYEEWAS